MQAFLVGEAHQSWNQPTNHDVFPGRSKLFSEGLVETSPFLYLNLYASNQEEEAVVMTRWAAEANLSQQKQAADYKHPWEATKRLQRRFKFASFRTWWLVLPLSDDCNTLQEGILLGRSSSALWCIRALSSSIFTKIHSHAFPSVHAQISLFEIWDESCQFQTQPGFQLPTHHMAVLQMLAYLLFYTYMYIYQCKYA